ncbi:bleomycin hydrolase [Drosophila serrata]|uniref:bleomycin hydrolase n=1 Tax=Drosophila serrata TaxID=7274 RepID=UPI000A1CF69A|nr:bleomycin hydrolase [Drosophila serrata]XP_020806734.1 bleomycin hydrolase [Drosophila serrata]XP_020806735.1 bleomycin hydrolase [Drosophila serrata]
MSFSLTKEQVSAWRTNFYNSPHNCLAQNVCSSHDPMQMALNAPVVQNSLGSGVKSWHMATGPGKATTGGPGWICTGLDMLRLAMDKQIPLPVDFEFSASHLVFYHKLERCNYFLINVCKLLESGEALEGRLFQHLLKNAVPDGGNFDMFRNLVKKYGIMPRSCYLHNTSSIAQVNKILRSKLREYACRLHQQFTLEGDSKSLPEIIKGMLPNLYNVLVICLGEPPVEFTWEFLDQKKRYQCLMNINSVNLYDVIVGPTFKLDSCVSLAHDPRETSSYNTNYKVAHSSNMVGTKDHIYNNQPMDVIMKIIADALNGGSTVWLGCDLRHRFKAKPLALSLETYKLDMVFGLDVGKTLTKAERLMYKDSRQDSTLLLTGIGLDSTEQLVQFSTITASAVGKDAIAKNKIFTIDADWLREYAFEIVVNKKFVPKDVLDAAKLSDVMPLPPWDPMGALYA